MQCTSSDGTVIGFDRRGNGSVVILVDAALCHRGSGPNRGLAERLSREFTVVSYDRRGRGESTDTAPYAVDREVEDLAALIDAAGGRAHVYGISSGGALALEAARQLPEKVTRLVLYEVPYIVDDSRPPVPVTYPSQLAELIAAGRRSATVKLFIRDVVGFPAAFVALMPLFPGWSKNTAVAHTLAYDAAVMGDGQRGTPLPRERWRSLSVPTLVASGSKSPPWIRNAATQLAEVLPNAEHRTLDGQRHYVKADAIAPVLTEFLAAATPHQPRASQRSTAAGGERPASVRPTTAS
jgi:pimeloyl-ACP methyl ester carboxylesterase